MLAEGGFETDRVDGHSTEQTLEGRRNFLALELEGCFYVLSHAGVNRAYDLADTRQSVAVSELHFSSQIINLALLQLQFDGACRGMKFAHAGIGCILFSFYGPCRHR